MGEWEYTSWGASVEGAWDGRIVREVFEGERTVAIVGSYEDAEAICAAHATIADLRDRLRVMRGFVCVGCGCTAEQPNEYDEVVGYCEDCDAVAGLLDDCPEDAAACISVGMRALCGRRILEGC